MSIWLCVTCIICEVFNVVKLCKSNGTKIVVAHWLTVYTTGTRYKAFVVINILIVVFFGKLVINGVLHFLGRMMG